MFIFGLVVWLLSIPLLAETQVSTQIYDIDYGKKNGDEILVLLNSGQVAKIAPNKLHLLKEFKSGTKNSYTFTLDKNRYIIDMKPINIPVAQLDYRALNSDSKSEYIMTTIPSIPQAKALQKEARYKPKESQCFNRAMVWTYEWWKKHSLKSGKILIYFTRSFVRRVNFEWWFHIAPFVHVMDTDTNKVVERVLDVKYTSYPHSFQKWVDVFMPDGTQCPIITKFSDYADYPYTGDCFLQRTTMYTYQPADLQMQEAWGYTKDKFIMKEVNQAYLEAFDEVH